MEWMWEGEWNFVSSFLACSSSFLWFPIQGEESLCSFRLPSIESLGSCPKRVSLFDSLCLFLSLSHCISFSRILIFVRSSFEEVVQGMDPFENWLSRLDSLSQTLTSLSFLSLSVSISLLPLFPFEFFPVWEKFLSWIPLKNFGRLQW